ncbi:MAG: response regulator transcription factor [Clostridiales bacterium]|nr:response regulator transcription factor [Clostridiales bacterium]
MKTTILIADGQKESLNTLRLHLDKEGYNILEAQNGSDALELMYLRRIDLAVLDAALPGMNGHYLIRKMKEAANIPILLLSSSDDSNDLRVAFRLGADDYIAKPFTSDEIITRIQGHLRRVQQFSDATKANTGIIRYQEIELDTESCVIRKSGSPLDLSPTEYKLLRRFMENPGKVFNPRQLYEVGWNDTRFVDEKTINDYISRIRTKLGDTDGTYIQTVPKVGYSFGRSL